MVKNHLWKFQNAHQPSGAVPGFSIQSSHFILATSRNYQSESWNFLRQLPLIPIPQAHKKKKKILKSIISLCKKSLVLPHYTVFVNPLHPVLSLSSSLALHCSLCFVYALSFLTWLLLLLPVIGILSKHSSCQMSESLISSILGKMFLKTEHGQQRAHNPPLQLWLLFQLSIGI